MSLTVTDIDRSVTWYKNVLGLAELMKENHPDGSGYAIVVGKPDFSMRRPPYSFGEHSRAMK